MGQIARESLDELKEIFSWINQRESSLNQRITVLVGGWAVYSYNDYWGSIDIDIITNSRTKKALKKYLLDHRDYHPDPETTNSVFKETNSGRVIIDIANRGSDIFEGNMDTIELSIVDDNTEVGNIEGVEVPVPNRSVLLMMKIKAAWDRKWRVNNDKSEDPEWDRSKMIKDHSDILALIDIEDEIGQLDIDLLGDFFRDHPFLESVIDDLSRSREAFAKYGIEPDDSRRLIDMFRSIVIQDR